MNLLDQESLEPASTREWSDQQAEVFARVADPQANLQISAVAGSGKTTTLCEAMRHSPGQSLFLAFNKSIAQEIESRGVLAEVRTLNSLGFRLCIQNLPKVKMDTDKVRKILSPKLSGEDSQYLYDLQRAIGFAKGSALGVVSPATDWDFEDLLTNGSDIPLADIPGLAKIAREAFDLSLSNLATIDFDDQVYLPIANQWIFPRFTSVFIDEDQDLNPINHLTLDALGGQGARICGVGDPYQAIYGFRGALSDSIPRLVHQFQMTELPLSTTYRCAQSIVGLAKQFCPEIQARAGAPQGEIQEVEIDPNLFLNGNLILCRTNAPLFKAILRHVRARRPCQVLSNFLQTFQSWIRRFKATSIPDLKSKAEAWYWKEYEAAKVKGLRGKMSGLTDRYQTLLVLCQDATFPEDIVQLLKQLESSRSGPIFSTIHKAKGLEAASVYILRPDLCPAPWDPSEEAQRQERNLQYVAITRAKEILTFGPGLDDEPSTWSHA